MNGLNRGSFSFVALLVINPIVILFYQNCSMAPLGQQKTALGHQQVQSGQRVPSGNLSHGSQKSYWESDKTIDLSQKSKLCLEENQTCYNSPQRK
jgi:hypothetical protein